MRLSSSFLSSRALGSLIILAIATLVPVTVLASEAQPVVSGADTVWVLCCAALVMLMTPGLALFYGGMVRAKNVLSTLMHSFACVGLITLLWVTVGYSLAFSPGNAFIGGFDHVMLAGVDGSTIGTIPHGAFMVFQLMFAIITPAIISGAFAERIKFRAFVLFTLAWSLLVYVPVCHWVWGPDGWLAPGSTWHALDFAGGTVVHISSGVAGLVMALVLGRREGRGDVEHRPHNLPLTMLGAGLLWFGWFGFNAGSALGIEGVATHAFVVTHVSAAMGTLAWMFTERLHAGRVSLLGAASGAIAGLVAITPACGFVEVSSSMLIGAIAGVICYFGVQLKGRLGVDDSLDAFGLHGVGGAWGALATGLFASATVGGTAGLLANGGSQVIVNQLMGIAAVGGYAAIVTLLIARVLQATVGLRVTASEEREGLDELHGEQGYALSA